MGEWSLTNAKNLSRILTCFHLASGLKVNFNKSKLLGVGVTNTELISLASTIGCQPSQFPCTYLGLPIGASISRCANCSHLIERFHKRLSKWKSKILSIGGRLTLTKSVLGSLGVYYFSTFKAPKTIIQKLESIRRIFFWGGSPDEKKIAWVSWEKVISPLNQGGIGIGSLKVSNHSLLAKWWWRFHAEESALWVKIIRSIHGIHGGLADPLSIKCKSGPWYQIARLNDEFIRYDINLHSLFMKKIGNGETTRFWTDTWLGGGPLSVTFSRLFQLESNQNCLVSDRSPVASVPHYSDPFSTVTNTINLITINLISSLSPNDLLCIHTLISGHVCI
ncbi:hypothetical protein Tco_1070483 [Tanacetum coccineum]|uniref:Uncharacterized protein n=1 Tax=Tanacetum coccineum TaxID=301880 RepID=A0ABQ5HMW6_9ASTR